MSPIVVAPPSSITRPEELVEFLDWYIKQDPIADEFAYIAKYDEKLLPEYPALHIQAANFDKTLKATHQYLIGLRAAIHVLHGNMMVDRPTRSYEDLALATKLVTFLESDMEFWDHTNNKARIVHGFIESELPGVLPPRMTKGDAIVSTRLNWFGINERSF